jgi:hypothetical protein
MAQEEFQEREEAGDEDLREEILVPHPSCVSCADLLHQWVDSVAPCGAGSDDSSWI